MEKAFRKDLSHLSWDEVYARQANRAALIPDWLNALRLKPGDRVLEIGAGPGFVSFALADRVGPTGVVYALDQSTEALAHLERRQRERGIRHIQRIVADAATVRPDGVQAGSALITMVLHHADDPAEILRNVVRFVPLGAPVVIGEFHPNGPCSQGPPHNHRIAPEKVREWCKKAGLVAVGYQRQSPEHYFVVARSQRRIGLNPACGCIAVHYRQLDVHQDEVGPLLCYGDERLLAVLHLRDLKIGRGQHIANDLPIIRLILYHQNALGHASSTCRSTITGSVKVKVEPCPGCDSTQIRPPCISMMRLDMASPKPVPPFLRVIALSAC